MPSTVQYLQAGEQLVRVDTDPSGSVVSSLMAPSLITSQRLRGVAFRGNMILTGSAAPGYIHTSLSPTLQPMRIEPPAYAPDLQGATKLSDEVGLTGAYGVRLSFAIKGTDGSIITESPLGPAATTTTDLTTQALEDHIAPERHPSKALGGDQARRH